MDLKRKVLPLIGHKGYMAFCAFQRLIIGLQMIPGNSIYSFEELCAIVEKMEPEDQIKTLVQAAKVVTLADDEANALICFCTDKNGVPYTNENKKNLKPSEFIEIIVTVCFHLISEMTIDLISRDEKKN